MAKKVLNLYAGIGGNRKLWKDVDVTAVEIEPTIAHIYSDYFPDDKVIVADAHQYLLDHYKDGWDFIWSSPPCPTHSRARFWGWKETKPIYPDMKLYQEILLLKHYYCGNYCVENVIPYYEPLMRAQEIGRHYVWASYLIGTPDFSLQKLTKAGDIKELEIHHNISIKKYKIKDERKILRNMMNSELGKHIFDCAFKIKQERLF